MTDIAVILLIVLIVVLVWRGPKTLPQLGRVLGRGVKGAREEVRSMKSDQDDAADPDPK
ncbi:MAG: twin-arginine translocase TatA/TatE family subunit [Candidatus Limnocylindrales bacterium]